MDSTGAPKPKQIESKVPGSTRSPATNASSLSRRQHRNKQIGKPVRKTHGKSVAECYESLPGPQSPSVVEDDDELDRRCLSAQSRTTERPEQAEKRLETICGAVRTVIECLGDDPDRESLQATPFRYAKALLFLTQGYHLDLKDIVNNAIFHERHDGMVIVKDIDISSLCEHHLVPFIGKMQIGYVPSDVIIGLSKLARIAEMFSRRLQIQERLTKEVAQAIAETLSHRESLSLLSQAICAWLCAAFKRRARRQSRLVPSAALIPSLTCVLNS